MDIQALIDGLSPKNYKKEMDGETLREFEQRYPDADERLQFLAANKALPYQHDVESFENPSLFTRIRREGLGIYTGPEKALLKKQERLMQDQFEPMQKARQQVGVALMHELARAPEMASEVPELAGMFGGKPQPAPDGAQPLQPGASTLAQAPVAGPGQPGAMQSVPGPLTQGNNLQRLPDGSAPLMRRPGPDQAAVMQAGMPLGTPGMISSLDQLGQLTDQPAPAQLDRYGNLMSAPPNGNTPVDMASVRPDMIQMADKKVIQQPPAPAPDRKLSIPERFKAAQAMHSEATGAMVRDDSGKLVPASYMHPDQKNLTLEQQERLADIYAGRDLIGAPGVKLPSTPYMAALKGKQEGAYKDLSQPIKDVLLANGLPPTPKNIAWAKDQAHAEKQSDELGQIAFKEGLQMYSKDVNDELGAMGVKNPIMATGDQIEQALKKSVDRKVNKHARELLDTFNASAIDATDKEKLTGLMQVANVTQRLKNEFTPEERREFVGKLNNPIEKIKQFANENPRFAAFDALVNREGIAAFETGGKALTAQEAEIIFGFLPNAKEWSPANFEAKLLEADDYARSKAKNIVQLATANRMDLAKRVEAAMPKESGGPKRISGDDDYAKLKPGDLYIDPKGITRRKQ